MKIDHSAPAAALVLGHVALPHSLLPPCIRGALIDFLLVTRGACAPVRLRRCAACELRPSPRGDRPGATVAAPPRSAARNQARPCSLTLGGLFFAGAARYARQGLSPNAVKLRGQPPPENVTLAFGKRFVGLCPGAPSTSSASDRFPQAGGDGLPLNPFDFFCSEIVRPNWCSALPGSALTIRSESTGSSASPHWAAPR